VRQFSNVTALPILALTPFAALALTFGFLHGHIPNMFIFGGTRRISRPRLISLCAHRFPTLNSPATVCIGAVADRASIIRGISTARRLLGFGFTEYPLPVFSVVLRRWAAGYHKK
jgi:hypothetical protein